MHVTSLLSHDCLWWNFLRLEWLDRTPFLLMKLSSLLSTYSLLLRTGFSLEVALQLFDISFYFLKSPFYFMDNVVFPLHFLLRYWWRKRERVSWIERVIFWLGQNHDASVFLRNLRFHWITTWHLLPRNDSAIFNQPAHVVLLADTPRLWQWICHATKH